MNFTKSEFMKDMLDKYCNSCPFKGTDKCTKCNDRKAYEEAINLLKKKEDKLLIQLPVKPFEDYYVLTFRHGEQIKSRTLTFNDFTLGNLLWLEENIGTAVFPSENAAKKHLEEISKELMEKN